jgi:hypothetical protein
MKVFVVVDVNGYVIGVYRDENDADVAASRREKQLDLAGAYDNRVFTYELEVQ